METANILIAKFMGEKLPYINNQDRFEYMVEGAGLISSTNVEDLYRFLRYNYNTDWNRLMQVVEKIESLGYRTLTENECFMITKSKLSSFDVRSKDDYNTIFSDNYEINHYGGSKKENVYNACVEFIKWYNENKSHL